MSQEDNPVARLLSYSDLILTLQKLCRDKQSGVMVINSESGAAKLTLEQGSIFDVSFGGMNGKAALLLVKKITQGKASFFKRAQGIAVQHIDLSTTEIFQTLTDTPQITAVPAAQETSHSVQFQVATEEQMKIIEAYLATIIGPVARIIYSDYKEEIQQADDLNTLSLVIEKIAKQVLVAEQQSFFKHKVRDFIQHCGLKNEQSILAAVKSAGRTVKLNPSTLSLCISKQAAQGESSSALLAKLATQVEAVDNLAGVVALADILKFLEKATKTGLLAIEAQEKKAGYYFDQGVLINAFDANRHGTAVALEILQWKLDKMTFISLARPNVAREIHQTVDALIKQSNSSRSSIISKEEGLKFTKSTLSANELQVALAKEIERLQKNRVPDKKEEVKLPTAESIMLITKAIQLAESDDNIGAEQLLSEVLQDHDEYYHAWFWLARVLTNMTAIEFALKKAAYINSKSSELADEVKKFMVARKVVKGDFVLRCPFCWMPIKEKDQECPHCLANFFIDPAFFSTVGKAKIELLDKAISRYNDALQHDASHSNVYLLFYLAMAYLNRGYYQEGLAQFNEIANISPENRALLQQSSLLTSYMQSAGMISTRAQQTSHNTALGKGKILVVEDSLVTRKVIARTLVAQGYEVLEAKDADEALIDIEARNPNLVLLDIILPGRSGYEILAEIKKMPRLAKVPVIMLTSRDSLFDKLKGKVSDADEYLTKPFQPDELLMIVKKYLK